MIEFQHNDGGRALAGFKGTTGDCVTRAIAIATGMPYRKVYDEIFRRNKEFHATTRKKIRGSGSPREGVYKEVYSEYLADLGWVWTPTMQIGQGCKVHLRADELPSGTLIVRLSRHLATVVDGVLHDNHDSSRKGTRCVYGYWKAGE